MTAAARRPPTQGATTTSARRSPSASPVASAPGVCLLPALTQPGSPLTPLEHVDGATGRPFQAGGRGPTPARGRLRPGAKIKTGLTEARRRTTVASTAHDPPTDRGGGSDAVLRPTTK